MLEEEDGGKTDVGGEFEPAIVIEGNSADNAGAGSDPCLTNI